MQRHDPGAEIISAAQLILLVTIIITDRISESGNAIASVRPSVHLFPL